MKKSLAFVAVLGLFLLGVVIGGLAMHLVQASRLVPPPGRSVGSGMHGPVFNERLHRHLDLTIEQRRQVAEILRRAQEEGRRMHEEMLPRVHELIEATQEEMREILTPEQRERFDEILERHRRSADRFFLGQGQGPRKGRGQRFKGRRGP
jgi:Spy/CpxP family protein refolding chaperone